MFEVKFLLQLLQNVFGVAMLVLKKPCENLRIFCTCNIHADFCNYQKYIRVITFWSEDSVCVLIKSKFLSLTQVRGLTDTCSVWRPWWRRRVGGSRNCSLTPPTRNWTTSSCLPPRCLVQPFWLEDSPQSPPTGLEWVSFPIIPCPLFLFTVINRTVEQFNVSQHRIKNSKGLREMDKGRMKGTGKLET